MVGGKVKFVGVAPRDRVQRCLFSFYPYAQILIRECIGSIIIGCVISGDRDCSIVSKRPGIVRDLADVPRADDAMRLCAACAKQSKSKNAQHLMQTAGCAPGYDSSSCTSHAIHI